MEDRRSVLIAVAVLEKRQNFYLNKSYTFIHFVDVKLRCARVRRAWQKSQENTVMFEEI